jgi:hypothetical protein
MSLFLRARLVLMKVNLYSIFIACVMLALPLAISANTNTNTVKAKNQIEYDIRQSYHEIGLSDVVNFKLYSEAYHAYATTEGRKKPLLTIIDYERPSSEKRFYVIDLNKKELLYHTYVSHGVNSGLETATQFSNVMSSRKTSLGTFLTDDTYYGSNGYSLRLDGLTEGQNDLARERYIVVHGADYVSESFIEQNGYLGRSWGCPALAPELTKEIIDLIKGGSVIYASA